MELVLGIFLLSFLVGYFFVRMFHDGIVCFVSNWFYYGFNVSPVLKLFSLSLFLSVFFLFFFLSPINFTNFSALGLFAPFGFFYNQLSPSEQTDCAC